MKENIHPTYHDNAKVTCACGNTFITGSTKPELSTEVCSKCHPFFTGSAKFVDTEGRVERFQRKEKEAKTLKKTISKKKTQDKPRRAAERPQSLKEMMEMLQKGK